MEGFLEKKGGTGDSTFGRRNWKKRWFILDGHILSYFESFDQHLGRPVNKKGEVDVEGCVTKVINHRERNFVFSVSAGEIDFYLCAESERDMKLWLNTLDVACTGLPRGINFQEYYDLLGLREEDCPTVAAISKAYRRAALSAHPDKGGDIALFKRVKEAFNVLTAKLEEEEFDKLHDVIRFEAIIQKGGKGIGFGMIVVEEPKAGYIYLKEVLPTMRLQLLSEKADRELKKGDKLVKVGEDDVSTWPLTRLVQRLNDFRVPVGTDVHMEFTRRVLKPGAQLPGEIEPPRMDSDFEGGSPFTNVSRGILVVVFTLILM